MLHLMKVMLMMQAECYGTVRRCSPVRTKLLLFRRNLAHIDPDTDDLACLQPHGAGGVAALCSTHRCVAGRDGRVLYALPPRASLPVVHGAGVVVAVPHLLQGTDVGTLDPS